MKRMSTSCQDGQNGQPRLIECTLITSVQAEDVIHALKALLKQATGSLRPPTKSEARTPTPAKTGPPAATRHALVGGILLLLDRAAQLSPIKDALWKVSLKPAI